jgi:TetR/AcrR family transcriptional repressor of nem operon
VARYGKQHKQATRQRILETAGRRLKRDGIDGAGIATLMADAGLTNGAFYAHFASKRSASQHLGAGSPDQGRRLAPGEQFPEHSLAGVAGRAQQEDPAFLHDAAFG